MSAGRQSVSCQSVSQSVRPALRPGRCRLGAPFGGQRARLPLAAGTRRGSPGPSRPPAARPRRSPLRRPQGSQLSQRQEIKLGQIPPLESGDEPAACPGVLRDERSSLWAEGRKRCLRREGAQGRPVAGAVIRRPWCGSALRTARLPNPGSHGFIPAGPRHVAGNTAHPAGKGSLRPSPTDLLSGSKLTTTELISPPKPYSV